MSRTSRIPAHTEYMVNQAIDVLDGCDPLDGTSTEDVRMAARYLRSALAPAPNPIPREALA